MNLIIRPMEFCDINACGKIHYEAFTRLTIQHGYPCDDFHIKTSTQTIQNYFEDPFIFGIIAEDNGRVLGSGFLHKRESIYAIGPVSIDPAIQQQGIGRKIMQGLLSHGKNSSSIRLLQDTFNVTTIGMYSSLGFNVTQPLLLMQGKPKDKPSAHIEVKPLEMNQLDECAELCKKVLGFDRTPALRNAQKYSSSFVALRNNKIVAYTSSINFWQDNHSVAETHEDMSELLLGTGLLCKELLSFLIPTLQSDFLRWCLNQGFRGISPRTQMVLGEYKQPKGCYLPSALY